jgi:hypothetical protein
MPWTVGFDEAGYGPNLGPLVQAAVAVRCPGGGCLWERLAASVRRAGGRDDGRIVIDDSKVVYAAPGGLARLERGVLASHADAAGQPIINVLRRFAVGDDLGPETWFDPAEPGPVACAPDDVTSAGESFAAASDAAGITFGGTRAAVTPPAQFNAVLDRHGTKAAVLAEGLIRLLRGLLSLPADGEPITAVIDKQGGRNFYAPILQTAFPASWVTVVCESAESSEYSLTADGRDIRLVFRPRAEQHALPVALASMVAKYLRERFMRQFNRYWLAHVPGLAPTAGYPADARRFFTAIRPKLADLGLAEDAVWRRR